MWWFLLLLFQFQHLLNNVHSFGFPGESFADQQQQEGITSLTNQVYNPLNFQTDSNDLDSDGSSRSRRSPTGKFLIIKGEIKDDSNDEDAFRILDRLFPSRDRVVIQHHPMFHGPSPYFSPPPFLGPPLPPPPFYPPSSPPFPDVSSVMVGPVYPSENSMPGTDYYHEAPSPPKSLVSPPFMVPPPPSRLFSPPTHSKYYVDDTVSEGAFPPDSQDRFKGISRGKIFAVKPKSSSTNSRPQSRGKKIKIGYIPAGKSQKDKGRLQSSQQFKMMEFVPEPEPAGCYCPNGRQQGNGMFFKSWPNRSKRCVKRCAYHDMLKKLEQEKAENKISM